jgi:vacuolar iron transporter family protein
MPRTPQMEKHFTGTETVRDVVIGMSDGLTVPFALAAGLTGAVDSTTVIVTAGLAEIAAGSIAMGLGGYLAAKSDAEHYQSEKRREELEVREKTEIEKEETRKVFRSYGLAKEEIEPIVTGFSVRPKAWVDFMMRFELGLEKPDRKRAFVSAIAIATSYIVGGFIPLTPYMVMASARSSLPVSVVVTLIALAVFGYVKARFTGTNPLRGSFQTALIGGLAAGVAFMIARLVS